MAQPFIRIVDGKLTQVGFPDVKKLETMRVVSILGKARMGKSSFLNAIASRITHSDCAVFQTQDNDEHCTRGIDFCSIPDKNLLLLDSQGLSLDDSSHDPTLLLFIYLISDVIVFNERMMLQNEALRLLEPMCTFMNYVDLDDIVKPILFFRISDGNLVKDPYKNLEKVLAAHPDQYQSIRESIVHLFADPIGIVKTNPLDKRGYELLSKNNYLALLEENEFGFQDAIDSILQCVENGKKSKNPYIIKLTDVINKINNNEHIKIEKLDIVGMTARNDIHEFIDGIDPIYYTNIEVDGTQKCFVEKVEPRKAFKKSTLTAFTKRFKALPKSMRESHREKLEKRLTEPIDKALSDCDTKARAILTNQRMLEAMTDGYIVHLKSYPSASFHSLGTNDLEIAKKYLTRIKTLEDACATLYEPVKDEIGTWIGDRYKYFIYILNKGKENELQMIKSVQDVCSKKISSFDSWINDTIDSYDKDVLITTNNTHLITNFKHSMITTIQKEILSYMKLQGFSFIMNRNTKKFDKAVEYVPSGTITIDFDIILPIYKQLVSDIELLIMNPSISETITRYKEQILKNAYISESSPKCSQIIQQNPEITFVRDDIIGINLIGKGPSGLAGSRYYMIKDTYNTLYTPLYTKAIEKMIEKGYWKDIFIQYELIKEEVVSNNLSYCKNIRQYNDYPTMCMYPNLLSESNKVKNEKYLHIMYELFTKSLKKFYCQEIVKNEISIRFIE